MRHLSHLLMILLVILQLQFCAGIAKSDAIGDNPTPLDIHIRKAEPLSAGDSYERKFLSYQSAEDDYDFRRFVTLFTDCAHGGDALCQYFLADGVSQWLWYDIFPHDKRYDSAFVRRWLRRAARDSTVYGFVTLDWSAFYRVGAMGFPSDHELYLCWREVANSNNDMAKSAVQSRFDKCKSLERAKFGDTAPWLNE